MTAAGKPEPARLPGDDDDVRRLTAEVEATRDRLGGLVERLDRRRHAIGRWAPRLLIAVAALGVAGGAIAWAAARRRRATPASKLHRLRAALDRVWRDPDRLANAPRAPRGLLASAATAAGGVLAKHLTEAVVRRRPSGPRA